MFKQSSIGLKYLLIFIVFNLVTGVIRTETILYYTSPEMKSIVRATGYISLFINNLISFLIILLAFYITYILFQKRTDYTPHFTYGIQYFAMVLMAGEMLKLSTVFIFLKNELSNIDMSKLSNSLIHTDWYTIQPIINLLSLCAGILLFTITIRDRSKKKFMVKDYVALSFPPLLLLLAASFLHA